MVFNSLTCVVFFALVLLLHAMPLRWTTKKFNLLIASYLFYAAWNPPFVILLRVSTMIDWWAAKKLVAAQGPSARRAWMLLSVAVDLGMLGYFKYGGFLMENFSALMAAAGVVYQPPALDIVLPVGISFYTLVFVRPPSDGRYYAYEQQHMPRADLGRTAGTHRFAGRAFRGPSGDAGAGAAGVVASVPRRCRALYRGAGAAARGCVRATGMRRGGPLALSLHPRTRQAAPDNRPAHRVPRFRRTASRTMARRAALPTVRTGIDPRRQTMVRMQCRTRMMMMGAALYWTTTWALAQQSPLRTYANPLDIDYRYNFEQINEKISYRTGADPVFVRHGDAYYLFQTLADGYWRSTDLLRWTFIAPSRWPFESIVAPAAISDGKRLILMPSMMDQRAVLVTTRPETGQFEFLTRKMPRLPTAMWPGQDIFGVSEGMIPPGPWDPALFANDDGRWYLYWGSSSTHPLYGIEIDPKTFAYIGKPKALLELAPQLHGWERFGQDHRGGTYPDGKPYGNYLEGAWMTKVGGRYYLQYGAPGTEYNAYANGTYVGDSPLGPFTYAPWNPVAYKPGGFVIGAGHGSTFQDAHGNWWNSGTPWVGHNWNFERRIGLWPAAFYDDGQMRVSTRFGDFPHWMPDAAVDDPQRLFTGWMLLSYRKAASASSTLEQFDPALAADENPRSFWVAGRNAKGETLTLDLGAVKTVRAVQVNYADYASGVFADGPQIYTEFALQHSDDGRHWRTLAEIGNARDRRDRPNAYVPLPEAVRARYVRYVHGHVGAKHLAISDLRVFGNADGAAPSRPAAPTVRRDRDRRNGFVRWQAQPGVVGYNVCWGLRPDRLTLCYQVFSDAGTTLELRALNRDQHYHVAVEAFNETAVSPPSEAVPLP